MLTPSATSRTATGRVRSSSVPSPSLEFEVNLPATWNRRAVQMGGGGYNGTLVTGLTGFTLQPATVDNPLKQGYVTLGSDGGHKSTAGFDGTSCRNQLSNSSTVPAATGIVTHGWFSGLAPSVRGGAAM